jgi:hypothetical protein
MRIYLYTVLALASLLSGCKAMLNNLASLAPHD